MSKSVVIVSSYVDATIRDGNADTDFLIFHTIEELASYIELTPVRANQFVFTKETIPNVNTSLNYIAAMLENPFFKVDNVIYITERNSRELVSVRYIIAEKNFSNWEIVEGALTKEYVHGVITGSLRKDVYGEKRKAVYRVPRASYVQDRIKNRDVLNESYVDDDNYYSDIPDVALPDDTLTDVGSSCEIIHIVVDDTMERTAFTYLMAQYMSLTGKTLIREKDKDYHRLSEMVTKSEVDTLLIDMTDLIKDPENEVKRIKATSKQLITVICKDRVEYSYPFISSLLYHNLSDAVSYFISEDNFEQAPTVDKFAIVTGNTVIDVLKACESIDGSLLHLGSFVAVEMGAAPEIRIGSERQLCILLSDILETRVCKAPIVHIDSLKLGGCNYDLHSIISG